jgi:hypothetical protein
LAELVWTPLASIAIVATQGEMELGSLGWCTTPVRAVALVLCFAAFAAPSAFAKGRISVVVGDSTPRAGHAFPVVVRTDFVVPADDWLRLIAVAPGKGWHDVVGTVTGDSSWAHANIPHDGFEIKLARVSAKTWRAVVRLPRPGRWRLVVPNGTHFGFMEPPPAAWMPWVQVHE